MSVEEHQGWQRAEAIKGTGFASVLKHSSEERLKTRPPMTPYQKKRPTPLIGTGLFA
jgi:hypothetical protein